MNKWLFVFFIAFNQFAWAQFPLQELDSLVLSETENRFSTGYKKSPIELKTKATQNLREVLRSEPSFGFKDYSPGGISTLSVRGSSSSQSQVFWNGIPLNSITLGQSNLNTIPVLDGQQISVLYGGGETGSYPGSIGASIYIDQALHFQKKERLVYGFNRASFGSQSQMASFSKSNEQFDLSIMWSTQQSDNNYTFYNPLLDSYQEREKSLNKQLFTAFHFAFKTSEYSYLKTDAFFNQSQQEVPPALALGTPQDLQQQDENDRTIVLSWQSVRRIKSEIRFGNRQTDFAYRDPNTSIFSSIKTNQNFLNLNAKTQLNERHILALEANFERSEAESTGFESAQNQLFSFLNFNYKTQFNKCLNSSLNLKTVKRDQHQPKFLVSYGLDYLKNKTYRLYGFVGNNIRYPTFNDLFWKEIGQPELKPEKSIQSELGLEWLKHKNLNSSFSVYYTDVKDWILWLPSSSGTWKPQNAYHVISKGFDFQLTYEASAKKNALNWFSGFYGNLGSVKNQSTNRDLIYTSTYQAQTKLGFQYKAFRCSSDLNFYSKRYISTDNSGYLPAYQLLNL
ncbi:MAG: TonB-dependent receptor plug domain-containing protein, partial [Flavobacteriales bacterium]